jgi:hypothetical protein
MIKKHDMFELWVERTNGKGLKLFSSKDPSEVKEIKDAIDHCVQSGESTLELGL